MQQVCTEAIDLAKQNVRFFPVVCNEKVPAIDRFSERATSDPELIKAMFANTDYNSGIACGKYSEGLYLLGLDIDNKDGRDGYKTLADLDMLGFELPETWTQKTTTGGEHRLFWSDVPIRQGTNVLGIGVDTRGDGGYLVGPGSQLNGKRYECTKHLNIQFAPQWLRDKYIKTATVLPFKTASEGKPVQDQILAMKRAVEYLNGLDPAPVGSRNNALYNAILRMKDFGLDKAQMPDVVDLYFKMNEPLDELEILLTVERAFKYGKSAPGFDAPENIFDTVLPPTVQKDEQDEIDKMNKRFFYCADNGLVCEEKTVEGEFRLIRRNVDKFHQFMLPYQHSVHSGDGEEVKIKYVQTSKSWMSSPRRRTFGEVRFIPRPKIAPDTYNLWKGFRIKPADDTKTYSEDAKLGFYKFLEHCQLNICDGDAGVFEWLMNFVAHMFQKPWEKPPISVVFQGLKGTGKNIFIDVLKHMIGKHSVTVSGKHTLTSNFNSMLEDKILVALDEAFWSGDKSIEGNLKSMITDSKRNIERKGEEPYTADVYDRIFILGNEEQLVNATGDERRFAVLNVAAKWRGNTEVFGLIMDGVREHGTDALLMRYFLDRDISKFNARRVPLTEGLRDQKEHSLSAFELWWRDCLFEGRIIGDHMGEQQWPKQIKASDFFGFFASHLDQIRHRGYRAIPSVLGKQFKKMCPSCAERVSVRQSKEVKNAYVFCTLDQARREWNETMGFNIDWKEDLNSDASRPAKPTTHLH